MPSTEILSKLAENFDVSTDYLLGYTKIKKIKSPLFSVPSAMMNTPPRIFSLLIGKSISDDVRNMIAAYTGCSLSFLFGMVQTYAPDNNRKINPKAYFEIVEIMDSCAENENYKTVQVQLSLIVLHNLNAEGINESELRDMGLMSSVLDDLFAKLEKPTYTVKHGFNISDLYKIKRNLFEKGMCDISIEYMLTGIKKPAYCLE